MDGDWTDGFGKDEDEIFMRLIFTFVHLQAEALWRSNLRKGKGFERWDIACGVADASWR